MNIRILGVFFFVLWQALVLSGQVVSDAAIQKELDKRGLERSEVEAAMLAKGVDVNTVDVENPEEVLKAKKVLDEVLAELEKAKNGGQTTSGSSSEFSNVENKTVKEKSAALAQGPVDDAEIIEAVKDGATVDEAVSQQLQEGKAAKLPKAKLFGHHLYRQKSIKFYKKSADAAPPSTYIIGPGDAVAIEIWGVAEESMALKVNNDGYIKPDQIPRIYLKGLSLEQAGELVKSRFDRYYRFKNSNFEINISTARTINVNISGEVFDPGNYNISALNNAINALVAAGGPTDIGSVRKIKLIQAGKVSTIDLYEYLVNPSIEQNYYLAENDYIVVPVAERVVTINGAINKPYKYELLESENLKELIKLAGGLKYDAFRNNIKVKRIDNDQEVIINVDLAEVLDSGKLFELKNGDQILIDKIPNEYRNIVSVAGAVDIPGEFAFEEGMKLSELLELGKLSESAILDLAYLIRLNDDLKTVSYITVNLQNAITNPTSDANVLLKKGDKLEIRSGKGFADAYTFSVSGAVRSPGEFKLDNDDLRLSDAIFLSNGLVPSATEFAYLIRKKPGDIEGEYINVDIKKAIDDPKSSSNIKLTSNDNLVVLDNRTFTDDFSVGISGAVKRPGSFLYVKELTVKDLILRSGGLNFNADANHIDVYRLEFLNGRKSKTLVANVQVDENYNVISGENFKLRPFDEIVVREASEFEYQKYVFINGEMAYPGKYAIVKDNMRLSDLIKDAGGLTKEAFGGGATLIRSELNVGPVVIDLNEALKKPGSTRDLILQRGDKINIPKISNLVTVSGATNLDEVYNNDVLYNGKINLVYEEGKDAKYYICKYAGGFDENADKNKVLVRYPNGEVKKSQRFLFFRTYPEVLPGSSIEVMYKKKETEKVNQEQQESNVDWGEVLASSVAQATAVLSLILLVRSLD